MKRHDRAQGPSNAFIRIKLSIHGALLCSGAISAVAGWAPEPPRRKPKKFSTTITQGILFYPADPLQPLS